MSTPYGKYTTGRCFLLRFGVYFIMLCFRRLYIIGIISNAAISNAASHRIGVLSSPVFGDVVVFVAAPDDTPRALFQIGGSPRTIKVVRGDKVRLDVGARAHLLGAA